MSEIEEKGVPGLWFGFKDGRHGEPRRDPRMVEVKPEDLRVGDFVVVGASCQRLSGVFVSEGYVLGVLRPEPNSAHSTTLWLRGEAQRPVRVIRAHLVTEAERTEGGDVSF